MKQQNPVFLPIYVKTKWAFFSPYRAGGEPQSIEQLRVPDVVSNVKVSSMETPYGDRPFWGGC